MKTRLPIALLCAAFAGWVGPAAAQSVYRCGDSYSHKPCPGGKLVDVEDARSAGQKTQTDQAVQRDAKAAEALQKARLKEEAKPASLVLPPEKPLDVAPEDRTAPTAKAKKPHYFTAVAPRKPGEDAPKKKKKAKKKSD